MKTKVLLIFALLTATLFAQVTPGGGIQPVNKGGTGAVTAAGALANLGAASNMLVLEFNYSTAPAGATGGSGSWSYVIPSSAKSIVFSVVQSSGGGGGAGGRFASGTNGRGGGAGGSGARLTSILAIPVSYLPSSTLTIVVGQGGSGATGQTTNDTAGATGSNGGQTNIDCGGLRLFGFAATSPGQGGVGGGNAAGGTGGAAGVITGIGGIAAFQQVGLIGSAGGTTGVGANGAGATISDATALSFAGGGPLPSSGGGGALATTPVSLKGGDAGDVLRLFATPFADGPAAVVSTTGGNAVTAFGMYGSGAAGGSSNASGAGFAGGNGALGTGGGGGGASLNGSVSGAGGNGGDAYVRILIYF